MKKSWFVGAVAICWTGCGAVDGGEAMEPADPETVGRSAQALGNFAPLWSLENTVPLTLTSTRAMFAKWSGTCVESVLSVDLSSGSSSAMPFAPGVCRHVAAAAADTEVLVQDSGGNDVLRYTWIAEGVLGWIKVADTQGIPDGNLVMNASHVFWSDTAGVRRAPRSGGAPTTVKSASNAYLLALDGVWLYYTLPSGAGVQLRKVQLNGTADALLATYGAPITDLSFDSTHLYWPDNSGGTGRIMRLLKSTNAVSRVGSAAADRYYYTPRSTGSTLYAMFLEGSECWMNRRNLSSHHVNAEKSPWFVVPYEMRIGSDGVYTAGLYYNGGVYSGMVLRGDL